MEIEKLVDLIYKVNDVMVEVYDTLKELDALFLTNDEYDNCNDLIYELPRVGRVSKRGFYIEYAITKITKGGNITAKGICEDYGDEIALTVDELDNAEAIALLNYFN